MGAEFQRVATGGSSGRPRLDSDFQPEPLAQFAQLGFSTLVRWLGTWILPLGGTFQKMLLGWRDSTAGKTLTLHAADLASHRVPLTASPAQSQDRTLSITG